MRKTTVALGVAAIACATAIATAARTVDQQAPPRDVRVEPRGTGVIAGIVLTADAEPRPLRRATVQISSPVIFSARQVFTADDGTFVFAALPAGEYSVRARRNAYMEVQYGARRPGGSGTAVVVREGAKVTGLEFRLPGYASISGVVYDVNGEPAVGVSVEALRHTMRTGRRTLSNVYGVAPQTDDRGVYTVGGLLPGTYYLAAGPSPSQGGNIAVQVLSAADVDRAIQMASSASEAVPVLPLANPIQGYAPIFFPGSFNLAGAQPIQLAVGEERSGVDFRLQMVPTSRLSGTVSFQDGRAAAGVQVVATPVTEAFTMDLFSAAGMGAQTTDSTGRFTYPSVPPGRYSVTARLAGPSAAPTGPLWAATMIDVSGEVPGVALTLQPGFTIPGRVVYDGTAPRLSSFGPMRISMPSVQETPVAVVVPAVAIANDGAFQFTGAAPGQYLLNVTAPPAASGWAVRSAIVRGVDVLDAPFTIDASGTVGEIVVTLTDRPTDLSGTLTTPAGDPTSDYFIVVFSTNRAHWLPNTRRNVMARPTTAGSWSVRNLPPGEYFVVALTDVEYGDWFDPKLLESVVNSAVRVTLGEGEKKRLDLRMGGLK